MLDLDLPQKFYLVFLSLGSFLQFLDPQFVLPDFFIALFLDFLLIGIDDGFYPGIAVDFLLGKNLVLLDLLVLGIQDNSELAFQLGLPVLVLDQLRFLDC